MKIAIVTLSATTSSGSRAPIELACQLQKLYQVSIFAQREHVQKNLKKMLTVNKIDLILYKNMLDLIMTLKRGSFDIVSFHAALPQMIAAKLAGIPIIKTYYGTQLDAYMERFLPNQKPDFFAKTVNFFANKIIWCDQKIQLILADKTIAISKYAQKELKKFYNTPSTLIYLAIDPSRIVARDQRPETRDQTNILSVSRFTPYKGFHIILDAAQKLRSKGTNVKVTIAGSTQNRKYLDYLKKIRGGQDEILTNVSDKKLAELYADCDIYVSCDRHLFFGLPILEASLAAKPTVALKFAAAQELIYDKKTGYLAASSSQLAKYLEVLATNSHKKLKMGQVAKAISQEKFDKEKIVYSYIKIFQKHAKSKSSIKYPPKSKIILVFVGIILSFTILEIFIRTIISKSYSQTLPSFFQSSSNSIIELKPGATQTLKSKKAGEFSTAVHINNQGLRNDHDYQIPKPENTFRILMLGDSFTFGYGVELNETFSKLLEKHLNQKYPEKHFEVINAGLADGFTWDEAYIFTKEKGLHFQPDLIVENVFLGNDIIDFGGHKYEKIDNSGLPMKIKSENLYVSEEGFRSKLTIHAKTPKLFLAGVFNNLLCDPLALCRLIRPFVEKNVATFIAKVDPRRDLPYFQFLEENLSQEVENDWQSGQKSIIGLNQLAKNNNIQLLIVNIPIKEQVWDPNSTLKNKKLDEQRFPDFLQKLNINYCQTNEKLKENASNNYFQYDSHLTPTGHQQVAEQIEKCLRDFNMAF